MDTPHAVQTDQKTDNKKYETQETVGNVVVSIDMSDLMRNCEIRGVNKLVNLYSITEKVQETVRFALDNFQRRIPIKGPAIELKLNIDLQGTAQLHPDIFERRILLQQGEIIIRGNSMLERAITEQLFIQLYNTFNPYVTEAFKTLRRHPFETTHMEVFRAQRCFAHTATILVERSKRSTQEGREIVESYSQRVVTLTSTMTNKLITDFPSPTDTEIRRSIELYYKLIESKVDSSLLTQHILAERLFTADPGNFVDIILESTHISEL